MNKTILLVEDNSSDEKLTLLAFKRCGVANEVVVVRDGAAALDYLFANAPPRALPALVLLDLKLPKVDGLDVLSKVRSEERTRLLPVVVLTASKEEEDILQSYARGCNAYVRKPLDFSEFSEVTKTLAAFWLLLNEPLPERAGALRP